MFSSQHEIEKYLDEIFKAPGFFLEIGCWDGELISQTAWLERVKGWSGLCVDPFPVNFEKRVCVVCNKAVVGAASSSMQKGTASPLSARGGGRKFIRVSIDRRYGGDVSYFSGFKDAIQAHWGLIEEHCDYEEIEVETITIEQLYEDYALPGYIEFLSIDTEGSELEIFESIDFNVHRFGLIVFEHNEDENVKQRIGELLMENGYELLESLRVDDIYVFSHKKWLDNEYRKWIEALQRSTVNNFKEDPMVRRMLGDIDSGLFAGLVSASPIFEVIDRIGFTEEPGSISGVCLRMIYYANKVLQQHPTSIVEIGGGVGQFYAVLRALGYEGSYMILDLPEVQCFQIDYLDEVSWQTGLELSLTRSSTYDTCVSFYALGEFDDALKADYIENVVKKCQHGFILWNPHSNASSEVPFECTITDEYPLTYPGNKQLVW